MATPRVGQRDKQGRYWTGTGWKSLEQVMKSQQTSPGKTGEKVVLPGVGEIQYTGSKYGWQTKSTVQKKQSAPAKPEKPKDSRLDSPIAGPGPKGNQVGSRPSAPPTSPAGGSGTGAGSGRPSSPPAPPRQPAPESPAVREYMRSAAAARKSGDAAQMAKVRDTGLDIWRKKYADTLAKNVTSAGTQRGTGQSEIEKKAQEIRQTRERISKEGIKPIPVSKEETMTKEPYDLVLEYLFSQGHVETLEEALYVVMEMSSETIQSICEAAADQSDKQIDKGVKTTYKAQNVLDNVHQGRSRGLNRLSYSEKEAKIKRMRGRLKARRDDLFGERNRREDDKREKLKKLLGL